MFLSDHYNKWALKDVNSKSLLFFFYHFTERFDRTKFSSAMFMNEIKTFNNNLYEHIKNLEINFGNSIKIVWIESSHLQSQYVLQIQSSYWSQIIKTYINRRIGLDLQFIYVFIISVFLDLFWQFFFVF